MLLNRITNEKVNTMKKLLLLIPMLFLSAQSFSQFCNYTLDFEDTISLQNLRIDTTSNPNNIWQVGAPQKNIFTTSISSPNVIVTDTINSYPVNDTSSFTIVNIAGFGYTAPHTALLQGEYAVDSDTLTDFGMIEFSPDNGASWYDIVNDTFITNHIFMPLGWITLSGNSGGWQPFYVNLASLGPLFNIQLFDTVLWRFTFISDGVQSNKDGLMFDNMHFEDYVEGLQEVRNDDLISILPNPTSDEIRVHRSKESGNSKIQILNGTSQILYDNQNFNEESIDVRNLPNGMYFLKYSDKNNLSFKRFVVQH